MYLMVMILEKRCWKSGSERNKLKDLLLFHRISTIAFRNLSGEEELQCNIRTTEPSLRLDVLFPIAPVASPARHFVRSVFGKIKQIAHLLSDNQ